MKRLIAVTALLAVLNVSAETNKQIVKRKIANRAITSPFCTGMAGSIKYRDANVIQCVIKYKGGAYIQQSLNAYAYDNGTLSFEGVVTVVGNAPKADIREAHNGFVHMFLPKPITLEAIKEVNVTTNYLATLPVADEHNHSAKWGMITYALPTHKSTMLYGNHMTSLSITFK